MLFQGSWAENNVHDRNIIGKIKNNLFSLTNIIPKSDVQEKKMNKNPRWTNTLY